MSISFHRNFYCFCNINEIVIAFWNLNFDPLSLSCWVVLVASPHLNETRRISKKVVFIRQIQKRILRLVIDQSHLILSRSIQLDWQVKSHLYFCRILWNHNVSWSFRRRISLNLFKKFSVHLFYDIKVVKPRSVFPTVLWWGQINHNKIVRLRSRRFAKFFELLFRHVLRHVVVKYMVNILLVLGKETKEICIFSNFLTRQFEIILTQIQTITIWMPSTNVIGVTLVLFLKQEVIKYHQIFMLRGDFFWVRLIHKNYSQ